MNKRVHVVVSGKVQGIFFRSNIKKLADSLNVAGYVRNVDDDKLEAVFEGDSKSIEQLLNFCRDGPEDAEISAIIIDEQNYKGEFKTFSVRDK